MAFDRGMARPRWATLRAGLIALAIALGLIDGCPLPRTPIEQRLADRALGRPVGGAVQRLTTTRAQALAPVRPALDLFRVRQRWLLFAGADRHRFRMWIESRRAGEAWQVRYRAGDDDHRFRARAIEYRRLRGAWNPHQLYGQRPGYPIFAAWIADQIFASDRSADEVRVQMERIEIGPHGGARATGAFERAIVLRRIDRERAR